MSGQYGFKVKTIVSRTWVSWRMPIICVLSIALTCMIGFEITLQIHVCFLGWQLSVLYMIHGPWSRSYQTNVYNLGPLNNFDMLWWILKLLGTYIHELTRMYHVRDSQPPGQGHRIKVFIICVYWITVTLCQVNNFYMPYRISNDLIE